MRRLLYLFMAAMLPIPGALAQGADPVVIRFSHVVAPDAPKGRAAEHFARLAAERSGGRVRVEVYPNSRLFGDKDEMAALQAGLVEMLAPSLSKIKVLRSTEFELFDLPYLFADVAAVHRITQGPIGRELLDGMRAQGAVGLAFWDNGFKQMSANRPLRRPQDVRGLKMRIQPSKVLETQMTTLGASPVVMAFSEVFTSLKVGAVNGTENPVSNFYTQNMHHAQSHLTLTDHGWLGYAVLVNRTFWEGLPADLRNVLEEAMGEATVFANRAALEGNAAALAALEASGQAEVVGLSAEDRRAWREALAPVHEEARRRIPAELIERVYREAGYAPSP
ncbi:TRAP transporter substrate-binding protein [Pseudothauera rhizosphaerae]|uniref:DctP family TRAP transporter solute-binding subunit n=1 Tax=Pseudothauera rhizosphaerae TaxID=2565932 RepID=A0A4S4A9W3_9RHOO|nr:TRAP transporter substrate-binding protein [Pseudothauera rhizosphaerae]THF55371.1 DctP family TRAP transporter solute-binding subunit [Pseudothauera rhizosphaerae]